MNKTVGMFSASLCVIGHAALSALAACSTATGPSDETPEAFKSANLEPPDPNMGFHFETPDFEVPFSHEQQDCYFFRVPGSGTDPVHISRIEVAQNPGTHHMNIFRVRTILDLDPANGDVQKSRDGEAPCSNSVNWADWPLVINSQAETLIEWKLPEGVAHAFMPGDLLMLQTHYVNTEEQRTTTVGHVEVNFHRIEPERFRHELGTLFATKQSIRICQSNPQPEFSGACNFNSPVPVRVVGANGHFHSRGKEFKMFGWDGTSTTAPPQQSQFYHSRTWDDPPMTRYPELDFEIAPSGGIWYTCDYEWRQPLASRGGCAGVDEFDATNHGTSESELDCCYTFGGEVVRGEHCNAFIYYYPKVDDVNCF